MIRIFFLLMLIPASVINGWSKGFYGGIELGEANTHFDPSKIGIAYADIRNFGLGGRVFAGYDVFENLSLEAGYLYMKPPRILDINRLPLDGSITENSLDMLFNAHFKIDNFFEASGRFGFAFLSASPNQTIRTLSVNDFAKKNVAHFRPAIGIAGAYCLYPHLKLEVAWLHILEHRALPEVSFISLGLVATA